MRSSSCVDPHLTSPLPEEHPGFRPGVFCFLEVDRGRTVVALSDRFALQGSLADFGSDLPSKFCFNNSRETGVADRVQAEEWSGDNPLTPLEFLHSFQVLPDR